MILKTSVYKLKMPIQMTCCSVFINLKIIILCKVTKQMYLICTFFITCILYYTGQSYGLTTGNYSCYCFLQLLHVSPSVENFVDLDSFHCLSDFSFDMMSFVASYCHSLCLHFSGLTPQKVQELFEPIIHDANEVKTLAHYKAGPVQRFTVSDHVWALWASWHHLCIECLLTLLSTYSAPH